MTAGTSRKLILINGQPGAGKTTLKKRLAADLGLPAIGKDDFKEFLFDTLGKPASREWSSALGRAATVALNDTAAVFLGKGYDVIIESAFIYEFAYSDFQQVLQQVDADVLEIYCTCDVATRNARFNARKGTATRHIVHSDALGEMSDEEIARRYAPLEIGTIIRVDTTRFGNAEYKLLLRNIKAHLKEEKLHETLEAH